MLEGISSGSAPGSALLDANTISVPNLTHDDAKLRARLLQLSSYDVVLDLTDADGAPSERTFRSRTTVTFTSAEVGASTFIDVVADAFHEVTLNGEPVDVSGYEPENGVVLANLARENVLVVDADLLYTTIGQGLHRFVDPVDGEVYLYTQFETTDAKRMYACFDQPDLKATFTLQVTAPTTWKVISNGAVAATKDNGPSKSVHFATTPPMSTYITALVAGAYHEVTDHHDGIELGLYCRNSLAQHLDADELFLITKQGFDWYHRNFGVRYAFGKYDQLFVPEFNAGAMENAGCVTFLEDYVFRSRVTDARYERRAATILHEMAHMWFGDLVTMRWFEDLWLNESFAEWAASHSQAEATRWSDAWTTFCNTEKTWAYRQDQLPSTHPIACEIVDAEAVEVNFDGITYAKGASVLKQLVAYVGIDEFLAGVRQYFADNAYGNTTLSDLLHALESTSGRSLTQWSRKWLETSGVNTLSAEFDVDEEGRFSSFAIRQLAPTHTAADNITRPHRMAIGFYNYSEAESGPGRLVLTDRVEVDIDGDLTELSQLVGMSRPALLLVNDGDLAYAKIRLDQHSLATLRDGALAHLDDSLARTLCWTSAWDMVRDGELSTRAYLDLVVTGAPAETQIGVVQTVNRQIIRALEIYADPSWSSDGLVRFGDTALAAARAAEHGSDHQLAWVHAVLGSATTPEQISFAAGLLSGDTQLVGLSLDTDLRWAILQCLIARGELGEDAIASAAEADRTAAGARAAASARALIPTAESKRATWNQIVGDDTLSNGIMRAMIGGFIHSRQTELVQPYIAEYFAMAPAVWQRKTAEMAQDLIIGLFPSHSLAISDETVRLADEFLSDRTRPAALRRLVSEGRADIVRALHARQSDSAS